MADYMVEETSGRLAIRYVPLVVAIHWVTAALVLLQVYLGFTFHDLPKGTPERAEMFTWHKTVGVAILLLALIRLGVRLINPPPPFPADLPRWERLYAVWNHRIFYLLLIALPLTGLLAVSAKTPGATTSLIGGLQFPVIPGIGEASGDLSGEMHEWLVYLTIALLVLHVAAALKNQFINRGPVANRMWPFRSTR